MSPAIQQPLQLPTGIPAEIPPEIPPEVRRSELAALPARPHLKPGLKRVWRGQHTLQLGRGAGPAVIIHHVTDAVSRLLDRLDGHHTAEALIASGEVSAQEVVDLLSWLQREGLLDDSATGSRPLAGFSVARRSQLRPEYDVLVATQSAPGDGAAAFAARTKSLITVEGLGRVGTAIALLLNAAGVGQVSVDDPHAVTPTDVSPTAHRLIDVDRTRQSAVRDRLLPTRKRAPRKPNLVVVADGISWRQQRADALTYADQPHLLVDVVDAVGRLGPLVLPGRSACARCIAHHRADHDPGWPFVSAQLSDDAGDVATASLGATLAGLAASAALAFVERGTSTLVDAEVIVASTDVGTSRVARPPHPSCGCQWRGTIAS